MLLGRLRVRQKLVLLVLPLLVLVVIGAVPVVTARIDAAEKSSRTAHVVERAVRIGELVQELQQERLASLGFLSLGVGRERLVARSARTLDLAEQLAVDYGDGRDDRLAKVLRNVGYRSGLGGLRIQVLRQGVTGLAVYTGYTEAINGLVDALGLTGDADLSTPVGQQELALDSIVRHDEATAAAGAALFVDRDRRVTDAVLALVSAAMAVEDREERVFKPLAGAATVELYELVEEGPSRQSMSRYLDQLGRSPGSVRGEQVKADLLPKVESLTALARLVETRVAGEAASGAADSATRDRWLAALGIGVALLVLIGAVVLSVLITRSISRPLRRLTASADEVADVARDELVRVADTEDAAAVAPRLRPVRVGTADELGDLAKAFNRVQQVAADLVERQVVSRRNVATMFGNVGRRTQNLVGRQLAMIDSLERNEQDPALLDRLYRLDHVSTRLRRNANSLVVLSGAPDQELTGEPLSAADTIRSALGEIEGFQRVRLGEVADVLLTPHVTPDVILLLAELLENGTSFSPPHTEVEVGVTVGAEGDVLVRIVDHGLGMTAEQLSAENARLVERERLDLAPTDVLGLFVVGRLARRHGIRVRLRPTPGTGVTAEVLIPARQVVRSSVPAPAPLAGQAVSPPAVAVAAASVAAAGPGSEQAASPARDWWEPALVEAEFPAGESPPEVAVAEAAVEPPAPEVGPGGIVRRVRGAQLPDTGGPVGRSREPATPEEPPASAGSPASPGSPGSPDEARRAIEDFEEGVRRALQESAAARGGGGDDPARRNGHVRLAGTPLPRPMPTPPLPPSSSPAGDPADPTRVLVEEFEEGVRRALARLDAVSRRPGPATGNGSRPAPGAAFFERSRPAQQRQDPPGRAPGGDPGTVPASPDQVPAGDAGAALVGPGQAPAVEATTTPASPAQAPAGHAGTVLVTPGQSPAVEATTTPDLPGQAPGGDAGTAPAPPDHGPGGGPGTPPTPPGQVPAGDAGTALVIPGQAPAEEAATTPASPDHASAGDAGTAPASPAQVPAVEAGTAPDLPGQASAGDAGTAPPASPAQVPAGDADTAPASAGQGSAGQGSAGQGSAGQGSAGQGSASAEAPGVGSGEGGSAAAGRSAAQPPAAGSVAAQAAEGAPAGGGRAGGGPAGGRRGGAGAGGAAGGYPTDVNQGSTPSPAGRPAPGGVPTPRPPMDAPPPGNGRPEADGPVGNGLVRRVPGAQLPVGARAARPPAEPGPPDGDRPGGSPAGAGADPTDAAARDAAAARALVEEFEAGVERALRAGERGSGPTSEEGAG